MFDLSDFIDDVSDWFEGLAELPKAWKDEKIGEEIGAAFSEFGADAKNLRKEIEIEVAYDIGFDFGQAMEKKQIIEENLENVFTSPRNLRAVGEPRYKYFKLADHLFVNRVLYTHHAIYIGDGKVIQYNYNKDNVIKIHVASLDEFSKGDQIFCMGRDKSPLVHTPEKAVERAKSRVGEQEYNLLGNNCEQFVRWCRSGGERFVW